MAQYLFVVNAYLLLHEQTCSMLRNFVEKIDLSELNPSIYRTIDYSNNKDGTIRICLLDCDMKSLEEKFNSGYIAMNFYTLQQFLSL